MEDHLADPRGTLHPGESIEDWRIRKNPPPGTLKGDPKFETLDQWSGKWPMALKGSEALGSEPLDTRPNIVQSKEVSLLVHWMQAHDITTSADLTAELTRL